MCFADGSCRAGLDRRRQLDRFKRCHARTSTTLPDVCSPPGTDQSGTTAQCVVRPALGRAVPGSSERCGQLRGCQKEVGEQQQCSQADSTGRTSRTSAQAKSQSQGEGSWKRQEDQRGGSSSPRGGRGHQLAGCVQSSPDKTGLGGLGVDSSRSKIFHVPGSRASTYVGKDLLHNLLEAVLSGPCRLGGFCKSFVARQFTQPIGSGTASAEVFPMPIPYPEGLRARQGSSSFSECRKRGVNALVLVLNYLYLGRPRSVDQLTGLGSRLNKRQWAAVRHFESILAAWLDVSPVTPEVMGRTAAKVESLEEILSSLESQAQSLKKDGGGYFGRDCRAPDQPGKPQSSSPSSIGTLASDVASSFKPVDASRLRFVGRPQFDPSPYLDDRSKVIYQDPLRVRMAPEKCLVKPPKLKVHCSASEKIKLFELLDSSGRLQVHTAKEVSPQFGSGLFAVPKSLDRDRLILDSRGANLLEQPPGRWIKSLASAEALTRIYLPSQYNLLASGNDLIDFYYLFHATPSRARRNVLVGPMHPKQLSHLHALKPEHHAEPFVYGSLSSLAMGDTQAVELAQSCHIGLALQHDIIDADNLLTMNKPAPRTETMVGVVIDDFVTLSKVPVSGFRGPSAGAQLAAKMEDIYEEVGLIPNRKKGFRDESSTAFWGVDLDGEIGLVRGSLKRAIPLLGLMLQIVRLGYCTADLMQVVVGSVISLFLFRRRFLAMLDSLFASYRGRGNRDVFPLSGRVRSDLLAICAILPMAATNLRAMPSSTLAASDASSWGEAGVTTWINPKIAAELIRHTLRKSVSQTAFRYSDRRGLDQLGFLDKPRWQKMLFLRNFEQIWVEVKMFCCRCPIVVVTCLFWFLLCPLCHLCRLFIVVLSNFSLSRLSLSIISVFNCHCHCHCHCHCL